MTRRAKWLPSSCLQPAAPHSLLPPHCWSLWLLLPLSCCTHCPIAAAHDFLISSSPTLPIRSAQNHAAWNMTHPLPQPLDT